MLSFESMYTQAQDLVRDDSTDALTFLKRNINIGQRILETELGSFYTEETKNITTVASTSTYDIPADYVELRHAFVLVDSTTQYNLETVYDEDFWQVLVASNKGSYNDAPSHIIVRKNTFEIWPGSSSAGNTITLRYVAGFKELQYDDYDSGTVSDLANGDTTVTGSSTTFTGAMAGRYLKIDNDGVWYKIDSYTSATALELDRNFQGTTISGGSESYTIGEMPRTPPSTHHIPVLYSAMMYFLGYKQSHEKAAIYERMYKMDMNMAKETYGNRYTSNYLPGGYRQRIRRRFNPNYPPQNMS